MAPKRKYFAWTPESWDNGYTSKGRMFVYRPDYPNNKHKNGYVRRAYVVWWLNTGSTVPEGFCIHHINQNKSDDRFDNLQLMTLSAHMALHSLGPDVWITCRWCGVVFRVTVARKDRIFCSNECAGKQKTNDAKLTRKVCQWCGEEFYVLPCKLDKKYCSNHCKDIGRGLESRGKKKKWTKKRSTGGVWILIDTIDQEGK